MGAVAHLAFSELAPLVAQIVVQIALGRKLESHVHIFGVVEGSVDGEDVGMVQAALDEHLPLDLVKVERAQVGLVVHFQGHV
jgi:hypothetical protein